MDNFERHSFEKIQDINVPDPFAFSMGFDCEKPKGSDQENEVLAVEEAETEESLDDIMVCDPGSRFVRNGFTNPNSIEDIVLFINAGAMTSIGSEFDITFQDDKYFEGGDTFQTRDTIFEGGDYPFIYQSARLGNICYSIDGLSPGDYFLDLHFVEIININGPKGMRVFNVFLQDEKILSDFDIFAIVGANKPLQLIDTRFSIKDDGMLVLRFEGIAGSPTVSGICIRREPKGSACQENREYFVCNTCGTEIEYTSAQKKLVRKYLISKYEKTIQDLKDTLQCKTDECYQSWMSWTNANEQLETVRMELDDKTFQTDSLDHTIKKQADELRDISTKYDQDKKSWTMAINILKKKVEVMKQEHSQLSREAHECVESIPDLNNMTFAVQSLVTQCEDLKMKYNEEQLKRRKLYNQVQEAKGNIRVFCRCRPLSKTEVTTGCASVVDFDAAGDGELGILSSGSTKKIFKFDRVYTPKDDQVDVFADASPVVISVLDGYNVCIFAYGQTGTGKTFTMEGTEANRGVNYRTLKELFKISSERRDTCSYSISVSVLEVYNEQIRDLLATETSKKLEIKQASEGCHHIPGIVEAKVESIREVWSVLQAGSSARAIGSNNVNEHSSRSHCMLCIMVRAKNLITGECTRSKLWLVDLAGSERLAKTDVQGDRLKEAQNINRSLSALGDVISALANKSSHIPYRNSKLTHLLQDSLGGDSKTLMFVQISPSDRDSSETLSSLNFATRVRGVELGPARKQIDTVEIHKLKMMLDKARQESKFKDESLKKLEDNLQNLETKAKGRDQIYRNHLERIKELETQVEFKTSLQCQSERQILNLSHSIKENEEISAKLQLKVMNLENKLKERESLESTLYKNKVNELETKLKEQAQEYESSSVILQSKIKELERGLKEHELNSEPLLFQQKIKDLEDKLREREKQLESTTLSESSNLLRSTPVEAKRVIIDEVANEVEHHILRSTNSMNRQVIQAPSVMVKENDSLLHEARKKRFSSNSEVENKVVVRTPVGDNKGRHSDPPKQFARVSRMSKPIAPAQRPLVRKVVSRDPVQEIKERDSKKRMWSR
ncbi:kinesin-like protein KIN-14R isoform X1 [Primulina eburnea]|uniref:kinesin-like protein KIN-14R isoform X1 n=2 Tax=Primulina eburnea TaxID=1245227 RepID=UPI003C6C4685